MKPNPNRAPCNYMYTDRKEEATIPFMGGRPEREQIIQEDEIRNLIILLNTETSFETFLKRI